MRHLAKYCLILAFAFSLMAPVLYAQAPGWEKVYGGEHLWSGNSFSLIDTIDDDGMHIIQTQDGGYLVAANSNRSFSGFGNIDVLLLKLNPEGDTVWSSLIGDADSNMVFAVQQTTDGGYILAGRKGDHISSGNSWLAKTDAFGILVWEKVYQNPNEDALHDVKQTADGGYIAVGQVNDTAQGNTFAEFYYVVKTTAQGDTTWTKKIGTKGFDDWAYDVQIVGTTGYLIGGFTAGLGAGSRDFWFVRINTTGDTVWTKTFGGAGNERMYAVAPTFDGGFVGAGYSSSFQAGPSDVYVAKVDANGDSVWTKFYGNSGVSDDEGAWDIWETSDSGLIVAGYTNSAGAGGHDGWLLKLDQNGDSVWTATFGNGGDDIFQGVTPTDDGGYAMVGKTNSHSSGNNWNDVYVVKSDPLGQTATNLIHGIAFHDANTNCVYDSGEAVFKNYLVEVLPGPIYTTTDENGRFSVLVQAGNYTATISTRPRSNYWDLTCPPAGSHSVTFTSSFDSLQVDFGFEENAFCPLMTVDISAPTLQQCAARTFDIDYCNYGTVSADSSAVEIIFDPWLQVDSASIPWLTPQSGNSYVFDLDTVPVGHCGSFQVFVTVSCSAATGQSHCTRASIFPDTSCFVAGGGWDGSTITVQGQCVNNDTVRFTIKNEGSASMLAPGGFVVIEDIVLKPIGSLPNPFGPGDSVTVEYPANGSTWTLKAAQDPGHPLASSPSASIEGCGTNGQGSFSKGYLTMYPQFDGRVTVDWYCAENILPAIPTKQAFPKGAPNKNYINDYDDIDYLITFQNTTGQPVSNVVIRDTLPAGLNIKTVETGSSSHPYSFAIIGPGILQWTMDGVNIPDSSVNADASVGFIRFYVKQDSGNPVGTVIENQATVQMNFGPADPTPITTLTIGDVQISVEPPIFYGDQPFKVFPNPTKDAVNVELDKDYPEVKFELMGMNGEVVARWEHNYAKDFKVLPKDISPGIYVFRISSSGKAIGAGKLVIYR